MADGIYVSMNGAAARMAQLESIADNLANAQTPGFKAERPGFEAFLAKADTRDSSRVYPAAIETRVDLSRGATVQTNNPLDIMPTGSSFIGIKLQDGIALTRNGHVQIDPADGGLKIDHHPVVGRDGNPILTPRDAQVRIEPSGNVYANDLLVGQIGLFEAAGPVSRVAPSIIKTQDQQTMVASTDGLRIGEIETGNASPLEAAVQMVAAQRHYETSMQALATYKKMDERASEVGRTR